MLIILGGLPATGKTTIAKALSKQINATYLRIDSIEHVIKLSHKLPDDIADMGYQIAYSLARENLKLGNTVIADSVNPIPLTREAWREVAQQANSPFLEVEIICSDINLHQQRAESRLADIENFQLPIWQAIVDRHYEPWVTKTLTIDTSITSIKQAVNLILQTITS